MRQTRIELNTEADPIDGIMCGPDEIKPPIPAVVVCHAHPLLGGTADHPVVIAICRELADRGIASLRFSFRVGMRDNEALNASAASPSRATPSARRPSSERFPTWATQRPSPSWPLP